MLKKKQTKIGIVGFNGFVGSALYEYLLNLKDIDVVGIDRSNNAEKLFKGLDYVIHTANSPRRYEAKLNPDKDYKESVLKTEKIIKICIKYSIHLLLISSISARSEPGTIYGKNRRLAELLALKNNATVVRLGYMYSENKIYGALLDLFNSSDVYLSSQSEYSYSNISWNVERIVEILFTKSCDIYELGSSGSIKLIEIAKIINSNSIFKSEYIDKQVANCYNKKSPSIMKFIDYLNKKT